MLVTTLVSSCTGSSPVLNDAVLINMLLYVGLWSLGLVEKVDVFDDALTVIGVTMSVLTLIAIISSLPLLVDWCLLSSEIGELGTDFCWAT